MMRWFALLALFLPAIAQAQNERAPEVPELDVEVITAGGEAGSVFVQQQVLLKITLTSRHPFRTLQIETPRIGNAEAHVASRPKTREFSTYGGSGWRHQRITALFPLQSGTWTLPPVTASGSVQKPDGTTLGFETRSPARQIEVKPAHPYLNGFWWVAAEDIALSEEYSRDLSGLKIGDTVRRTVRMVARGTTAERLPELRQETTPGVSIHAVGGSQTSRFGPDGGIAEVTRSWAITVNSEDPVNIAPISVTWWHAGEARPASSGVPAGRIEPLAIDAAQLRADLLAEATAERETGTYLLLALLLVLALPVALLCLAALSALLPSRADLRLRRGLARAKPGEGTRAIVRWGQSSVDASVRTVGDLIRHAPPDIAAVLRRAQRSAYGGEDARGPALRPLLRWSRRERLKRLVSAVVRSAGSTLSGVPGA